MRYRSPPICDEAEGEETRDVAAAERRRGVRRNEPAARAERLAHRRFHGGGGIEPAKIPYRSTRNESATRLLTR